MRRGVAGVPGSTTKAGVSVEGHLPGAPTEPPIEHETLEPQEMVDGLVQVLREVYANDTF